jgi:glycosyltransferase involved in cell wall biosynthesis
MKLVIQNSAHVWGGNEKMLATVANGLSKRGHYVVISCAGGVVRERLKEMGHRVTRFRPRGAIDPASGLSFAAWLAVEKPDALLLTSWHSISWSSFGARVSGVKSVVLRQGIVRSAPVGGIRGYAVRNWITDVIVNAPEIRDEWIRSASPFPADRVHVVLNGVTPLYPRRSELRQRLRAEAGIADDTLLIGAAGILSQRKGFDLLLRAMAKTNLENVRLAIVGDGPYRRTLESLAHELGIESRVHFLGARDKGAESVAGMDVFVLSSHNEGMANVMLEAMAAGVPVIASDISGVRTAVGTSSERPPAGWIFNPGDVESLAACIDEVGNLVRNEPLSVHARTNEALYRIREWFSPDRMLDQTERILFGQ